ncbi:MAG: hypothetical protein AAGA12_05485 [Pseudomonadota bacterium]
MYQGDSFFTLSVAEQAGLLVISGVLFVVCATAIWHLARLLPRRWAIVLAALLFYAFVWLSPQIYYAYYRLIFDGLPAQWVVGRAPVPLEPVKVLFFSSAQNLSFHSQGILGWSLIAIAFFRSRRKSISRHQ